MSAKTYVWHVGKLRHLVDDAALDTTLHLMPRRIRPRYAASLGVFAMLPRNDESKMCVSCLSWISIS
jgi:hypothetical protein